VVCQGLGRILVALRQMETDGKEYNIMLQDGTVAVSLSKVADCADESKKSLAPRGAFFRLDVGESTPEPDENMKLLS